MKNETPDQLAKEAESSRKELTNNDNKPAQGLKKFGQRPTGEWVDKGGSLFNASKHKVGENGEPEYTPSGYFKKVGFPEAIQQAPIVATPNPSEGEHRHPFGKSLRSLPSLSRHGVTQNQENDAVKRSSVVIPPEVLGNASSDSNSGDTPETSQNLESQTNHRKTAKQIISGLVSVTVLVFGDEAKPKPSDKTMMEEAWADYLTETNAPSLPGWFALAICMGTYILFCLQTPKGKALISPQKSHSSSGVSNVETQTRGEKSSDPVRQQKSGQNEPPSAFEMMLAREGNSWPTASS